MNLVKGCWAIFWAVALGGMARSKSLLGTDYFGSFIWFVLILIRFMAIIISEGAFSLCGCSRLNKVRRFFIHLERIYMVSNDGGVDSVLGWKYVHQPALRSILYTGMHAPNIVS
jgi:hypothetical protein